MKTTSLNKTLNIRVLIYEDDEGDEEGDVVALAIDMDLRGYGDSEETALAEVEDLVDCQLQFALEQNDLRPAFFPADQKYFDMFEKLTEKQPQWKKSRS